MCAFSYLFVLIIGVDLNCIFPANGSWIPCRGDSHLLLSYSLKIMTMGLFLVCLCWLPQFPRIQCLPVSMGPPLARAEMLSVVMQGQIREYSLPKTTLLEVSKWKHQGKKYKNTVSSWPKKSIMFLKKRQPSVDEQKQHQYSQRKKKREGGGQR